MDKHPDTYRGITITCNEPHGEVTKSYRLDLSKRHNAEHPQLVALPPIEIPVRGGYTVTVDPEQVTSIVFDDYNPELDPTRVDDEEPWPHVHHGHGVPFEGGGADVWANRRAPGVEA